MSPTFILFAAAMMAPSVEVPRSLLSSLIWALLQRTPTYSGPGGRWKRWGCKGGGGIQPVHVMSEQKPVGHQRGTIAIGA